MDVENAIYSPRDEAFSSEYGYRIIVVKITRLNLRDVGVYFKISNLEECALRIPGIIFFWTIYDRKDIACVPPEELIGRFVEINNERRLSIVNYFRDRW